MKRTLDIAAAISLALAIAGAVLCVWSHWALPFAAWKRTWPVTQTIIDSDRLSVQYGWGTITVLHSVTHHETITATYNPLATRGVRCGVTAMRPGWIVPPIGTGTFWNKLGFSFWQFTGTYTINGKPFNGFAQLNTQIELPAWLPVVAACILPAIWVWRLARQRHRSRNDRCVACGYDLRATPDRCPECGTLTTPAKMIKTTDARG